MLGALPTALQRLCLEFVTAHGVTVPELLHNQRDHLLCSPSRAADKDFYGGYDMKVDGKKT
jgi:hypothetical protein